MNLGIVIESERESHLGVCHECNVKEGNSSQKRVYRCDLCNKWFCEKHLKPKFPYFVDWDTVFDVQGEPRIKALFHTEYKREGGHSDFAYWRKTFEALDIEEKLRNKLIQQAIDRMADVNKLKTEMAIDTMEEKMEQGKEIKTYENKFGNRYSVPKEVYSNKIYRERLYNANTTNQVETIVIDYYKHHRKEPEQPKKKHWWQ
ncbi:MAG TPA: hypothetical protein VI864_04170 [Candidatus Bathyarchaeia archaeon]|nr:hypothetical protein [Candidatus Bathyarchaeia archaeon]